MAFDFESLGGGGIGGIFFGILTALGLKGKVEKLEEKKLDKNVFIEFRKNVDEKFDRLIKGQDKIWDRLDSLNDFIRNQK